MKEDKLFDGITNIRDDLVVEAEKHKFKNKRKMLKKYGTIAVAAVLVIAIAIGVFSGGEETVFSKSAFAIYEPEYPQMAPYPEGEYSENKYNKWREDILAQIDQPEGYADGLEDFFKKTIQEYLSGTDGANIAYSPLNVYMALAMLSEITDGNSRDQILSLLGSDGIEAVREQAGAVWNANYRADGAVTRILGSSLWLRDDMEYNNETMKTLADIYYAASYSGEMGSEEYNAELRKWLSEHTGGLLDEQIGEIELSKETVIALATTIYYNAKWNSKFSREKTTADIFHAPDGDVTCDFMHSSSDGTYYWGERFSSVRKSFESGAMWFILPDEGVPVDELVMDDEVMDYILNGGKWENSKRLIINMSVPKFDVESKFDLSDGLKDLGITDVFDFTTSDFSPVTDEDIPLKLSSAAHGVRVKIDEDGCEAAAYTVLASSGAGAPPDEEVDFTLDRPFIFVITGTDDLPLFVGVVNNPAA